MHLFFFKWKLLYLFIYFIYFWLRWVFVSVRGLSLVAASRGHSSSRCTGLSLSWPLVAEHRLQTRRLSSCGSRAQSLRGMWDLPRPELELVSPALAGRLSTTAPPGKPRAYASLILPDVDRLLYEWVISVYTPTSYVWDYMFHILSYVRYCQTLKFLPIWGVWNVSCDFKFVS